MSLRMFLVFCLLVFLNELSLANNIQVKINVNQVRSEKGNIVVLLYSKEAGFPNKVASADSKKIVPAIVGSQIILIDVPGSGDYAISIFHDENSNLEIDTNWIGIPKEGVGVSNNAKGRMGPPKFKDAVAQINAESTIDITLKYL